MDRRLTNLAARPRISARDGESIRFVGVEHRLKCAPMLGEHSEPVLHEIAGLSQEEFDRLVIEGVVG